MDAFINKINKAKASFGFTFIEALVVIAIIIIIAGLTVPFYGKILTSNGLDTAVATIVRELRLAQQLAMSSDGDQRWGVYLQSSSITVFRGTSYAARTAAYDITTAMPAGITVTGLMEIVYVKLTGAPNLAGTITLTNSDSDTRIITINSKGLIE